MAKCGECLMRDVEIVDLDARGNCPRCGVSYGPVTVYRPSLTELACTCQQIFDRCVAADADLFGGSLLDLCADQISNASLADIKSAIIVAGIEVQPKCNERIRRQIATFR